MIGFTASLYVIIGSRGAEMGKQSSKKGAKSPVANKADADGNKAELAKAKEATGGSSGGKSHN